MEARSGRYTEAMEFGEHGGNGRLDGGLNSLRKRAAQFDGFGNDPDEQNLAGALTAQFRKEQRFDEGGIVRADTLGYGHSDELVLAVELYLAGLTLRAEGVEKNDCVVIGEKRSDAQAGSTEVMQRNLLRKLVTGLKNFENERADAVVAHQDVADAENADA